MDQKKSKNVTLRPDPRVTLSPHFPLSEMTKTSVKGVSNVPPQEAIENLKRQEKDWKLLGLPVFFVSLWRKNYKYEQDERKTSDAGGEVL